jgi:replicative DNA helicase
MEELFSTPPRNTVATPWTNLNKKIGGGFGIEEMTVFAAVPNAGKSFLLCHSGATAAMQGHFVLHITLEMSEKLTLHRYYSALTGVPLSGLKAAGDHIAYVNYRLNEVGGRFVIKQWPAETVRVSDIRDQLTQIQSQYGRMPDVLVVDYADLLLGRNGGSGRGEEDNVVRHILKGIYTDLRAIGINYKLAVVTASQANKGSLSKEIIGIADLAESFQKAAIADIIVAICQTEDEFDTNTIRLYVAKNRNEQKGAEIPLQVDFGAGKIIEGGSIGGAGKGAAAALEYLNQIQGHTMAGSSVPPPPLHGPGATHGS